MCLIINKPAGVSLDSKTLQTIHHVNPDGFGIMRATSSGRLEIIRTLEGPDSISKLIKRFESFDCALHWRFTTNGKTNLRNCHPFELIPDVAAMHNGVISIDHEKHESDTAAFCREVLRPMAESNLDALMDGRFNAAVELAMGAGSKILIMSGDGRVNIFNRSAGHDDKESGCWYSNTYSLDRTHRTASRYNYGWTMWDKEDSYVAAKNNKPPATGTRPAQSGRAPAYGLPVPYSPPADDPGFFYPESIDDLRGLDVNDLANEIALDPDLYAAILCDHLSMESEADYDSLVAFCADTPDAAAVEILDYAGSL
jgi:predicted glutamine amidotransferase